MLQNIVANTLPETNMETRKGPIKTTVPLKGGYMGFHVSLGECTCLIFLLEGFEDASEPQKGKAACRGKLLNAPLIARLQEAELC